MISMSAAVVGCATCPLAAARTRPERSSRAQVPTPPGTAPFGVLAAGAATTVIVSTVAHGCTPRDAQKMSPTSTLWAARSSAERVLAAA
jgi:hypothetical protein